MYTCENSKPQGLEDNPRHELLKAGRTGPRAPRKRRLSVDPRPHIRQDLVEQSVHGVPDARLL